MKPKQIMVIAGETSGDTLAAELVGALRRELVAADTVHTPDLQPLLTGLAPRFFGAGGPAMRAAGVELAFDMTEHSVIGLSDVLKHYLKFRRLFRRLYRLALEREPDAIICVDFSGFNRRFAHAVRQHARRHHGWFHDWDPKLIQYVSPQVWASRESRAYQVAGDYHLLLSIFPFEKNWYAQRVPKLRVEYVGHPVADRFAAHPSRSGNLAAGDTPVANRNSEILLLPGSRSSELIRHVPVMLGALALLRRALPGLPARMVVPNPALAQQAKSLNLPPDVELQTGGLPEALSRADLAVASTGTVTMECAWFGVPTVTLYKASWANFQIAKLLVKVKWLTMPNLLANEELFPEFLQSDATAESISGAALQLVQDVNRRNLVKAGLAKVVASLGGPGASRRAAQVIASLLSKNIKPLTPG